MLQSIPTYALSIFLALKGVIEDLHYKLRRTWWSGKDRGKYWSMLPWKNLCQPKGMRGIVPSSKYFPDGNFFKAKHKDKASFTWSSIAGVAEKLKNGFGWQIGNGNYINIRVDNWGMEDLNGGNLDSNMINPKFNNVTDLWVENERKWDIDKVYLMVFAWRVDHELLPMNVKISSIRNGFNQGCPRCGATNETLLHAFRGCPISREVLSIGGWDMSVMMKQYDRCVDWLENMMRILDKRAMADLITTLWNYWNSRNNFIFKDKKDKAQAVEDRASNLGEEFRIYNLLNAPMFSQNEVIKK
ncbi:uncharacterized protein LOC108477676 [Gossypium arboreum]|uniref:uncharacterized protein LOC108477676 n=1 Tax=Gossypium arboreum TaxID=29729 RepID=UPI0008197771|nr:uncharacterized protein LOC108477676 [Gossypium arboreum]